MAEVAFIEDQIKKDRRGLDQNLRELEDRARKMADWRTHYANHTAAALAIAAVAGAVLGSLSRDGGSRTTGRSLIAALDPSGRTVQQVRALIDQTFDAVIGIGSAKLVNAFSDLVPDFKQEFQARRQPTR
jgi:hypothetical protein